MILFCGRIRVLTYGSGPHIPKPAKKVLYPCRPVAVKGLRDQVLGFEGVGLARRV